MAILEVGNCHYVTGIAPVADAFDSTQYTDIVSMRGFHQAHFIIWKGVGATGTKITAGTENSSCPKRSRSVCSASRRCGYSSCSS